MSQIKNTSPSSSKPKPPVRLLLLIIVGATLVSMILWLIFTSLIGKDLTNVAVSIAFSCMSTIIISRWESIKIQPDVRWRNYIKLLKLKFWKIAAVFLTIFIWQAVFGMLLMIVQQILRPDFIDSLPDGFSEFFDAYTDDWLTSVVLAMSALFPYLLGGYVAGRLSRDQYLAPYSHAAIGIFIYRILEIVLTWKNICDCFTLESGGLFFLGLLMNILLSILGVKLGVRKSTYPENKKFGESLRLELKTLSASVPTTDVTQIAQHASKSKLPRKRGKKSKRGRRR